MENENILRILMVEDNKDDLHFIKRVLRKDKLNFINECVDTLEGFNEALIRFHPDIVLSDHGMPEFNSFEALQICLKEHSDIPFLLVTGTVSDEYAISCLKNGVDDYVLKSNLSRLPNAIRNAVKKRNLEKQKHEADVILKKQNSELLKLNEELDNFVYSVSHNLRGPLQSVVGLINLIENTDKKTDVEEILPMMRTSIARLNNTINDILEYSRNSRNEILSDYIDWGKMFKLIFSKIEYLHPPEQITTILTLNTIIPYFSDTKRWEVVLTNLLINTISYRDSLRSLQISIKVTTSEENVTIIINDNGIGIEKMVLPKIYTMFYRGTELSQGAGLGLYIAKEIVDKLKGRISITSMAGSGTTVTIRVPNHTQESSDHGIALPISYDLAEGIKSGASNQKLL